MTSRLLAFVLACIIGSPTCWCCLPHSTAAAKTAVRACCQHAKSAPGVPDKPAKRDSCPCESSLTKRDLADGKVVLPKPFAAPAEYVQIQVTGIIPAAAMVRAGLPLVDEDPPWRTQKLYQRDCCRLL